MKPFVVLEPFLLNPDRGWTVAPLRRLAVLVEEQNTNGDVPLLSLTIAGGLTPRSDDVQPPSRDYLLKYGIVRHGDLVVNPMWLSGGSIGVSNEYGAVSPEYRIYRFGTGAVPRFIHHLVRSDPYMKQYRLLVRAETTFDRRVTKDDFRELPILLPPERLQHVIADYLDAETARIDALIEKKQRMMDVLKQRSLAVIDETLVPVGSELPLTTLKAIATIRVSNVDKKTVDGEVPIRLCNYVDVYYHNKITQELAFMKATANREQVAAFTLRAGDVLFTKDSELADDIAVPAYVPSDLPGVVCGYHLAVARPRPSVVEGRYLFWALASSFAREQFSVAAKGVTRFGLRQSEMGDVRLPVPPIPEQRRIIELLDKSAVGSGALSDTLGRQVGLLRERRQALITAAVTGQLEIPGTAA